MDRNSDSLKRCSSRQQQSGVVEEFADEVEEFQEQTGGETHIGQLDVIETLSPEDGQSFPSGAELNGPDIPPRQPPTGPVAKDACLLGQDVGSCQKYVMKWFFDTEQSECARFWFGGCGGNANRFDTQEECESLCLTKRH